ncbi:DnaB-like helicase N-terminal domain-containing protein [Corynebacterium senegalense]|uniref:DnaB-like helicase N-terminal domain-containing protein n=1 Tax=Corynebacterium senegalense TaxID=2080750 RepID=UPI000E1FD05F|nr:DnaB-like helicase N-terminal domain-containing protein [Corynebacterium senegalense]
MTRPGFNFDPEVQVLNELLWSANESAASFVLETLREDDFYNPLYGQMFTAIKDSHSRGLGRDAVSVNTHLLANYDALGIAHPENVSHLLVNIAVLDTPQHSLRDSAYKVLHDSYRRGFDAVADALKFAAQEAPTNELFNILVDHGKQQRASTERLANFLTAYDAAGATPRAPQAAPEEQTALERIKAQRSQQGTPRSASDSAGAPLADTRDNGHEL